MSSIEGKKHSKGTVENTGLLQAHFPLWSARQGLQPIDKFPKPPHFHRAGSTHTAQCRGSLLSIASLCLGGFFSLFLSRSSRNEESEWNAPHILQLQGTSSIHVCARYIPIPPLALSPSDHSDITPAPCFRIVDPPFSHPHCPPS